MQNRKLMNLLPRRTILAAGAVIAMATLPAMAQEPVKVGMSGPFSGGLSLLGQSVRDGKFREDLLYRLNVVPIHMPPLRDRIADIVPLAEHFLREAGGPALGADAAAALLRHRWPGNVRELKNAMHRVATLVRAASLSEADVAFLASGPAQEVTEVDEDLPTALERVERTLIERALQRCRGNRTEAARALNIRRQHLYSRMEKYGLMSAERTPDVRQADDEP